MSTNGAGFSCPKWASNRRVIEGVAMVINQMITGQVIASDLDQEDYRFSKASGIHAVANN
jgi:hypothetical protein